MFTYQQSTGKVFAGDGSLLGIGWSGQEAGKNNPAMQDVANVGPLPRGRYTIGAAYHHPKLGPVTMDLTPDPANEMFGRADLRIHGSKEGDPEHSSEGCIIQERPEREVIAASSDRDLIVVE
jgi:hypothetical protein